MLTSPVALPPGTREARDQADADHVADSGKHDRNGRRGFLGRDRGRRAGRGEDEVHLQARQLGGEINETVGVAVRPSVDEADVLVLDVVQLAKRLAKRLEGRRGGLQR
jgi:hypothetical protein